MEYWRILLFKDIYNYGGIKESNHKKVSAKWDIAMHLPEAVQKKFLLTIGEYILKVYKYNMKLRSGEIDPAEMQQESED